MFPNRVCVFATDGAYFLLVARVEEHHTTGMELTVTSPSTESPIPKRDCVGDENDDNTLLATSSSSAPVDDAPKEVFRTPRHRKEKKGKIIDLLEDDGKPFYFCNKILLLIMYRSCCCRYPLCTLPFYWWSNGHKY